MIVYGAMIVVAVAGLALVVVLIVAKTREDGIIDGAYGTAAALAELLDRRGFERVGEALIRWSNTRR